MLGGWRWLLNFLCGLDIRAVKCTSWQCFIFPGLTWCEEKLYGVISLARSLPKNSTCQRHDAWDGRRHNIRTTDCCTYQHHHDGDEHCDLSDLTTLVAPRTRTSFGDRTFLAAEISLCSASNKNIIIGKQLEQLSLRTFARLLKSHLFV